MLRLIQALIIGRPSTDSSVQVCGFLGGWLPHASCLTLCVCLLYCLVGLPPSLPLAYLPLSVPRPPGWLLPCCRLCWLVAGLVAVLVAYSCLDASVACLPHFVGLPASLASCLPACLPPSIYGMLARRLAALLLP